MSDTIEEQANKKNLLQLVYLRIVAIAGQLVTVLSVQYGLGIPLPIEKMLAVIVFMAGLNFVTWMRYRRQKGITSRELFLELLLDVAALTTQLYLSGGASNPFISLFLLQVIIGAVLLRPVYAWAMFAVTFVCYLTLTYYSQGLMTAAHYHLGQYFNLHIHGMLISYVIAGFLLVLFLTRINANLKERDANLAKIARQSQEEDHIMRIGLLAAGAAHELGTPLTTISVILKDWQTLSVPESRDAQQQDINAMLGQVQRCKEIVSGILVSSGDVRGEAAKAISLKSFMDNTVHQWTALRQPQVLDYRCDISDMDIASDKVLEQILFNVFDNALESSPEWIGIHVSQTSDIWTIAVEDRGKGFSAEAIETFGKPYASEKDGHGRGLGLFLVVNTLRKLGGKVKAENTEQGAKVILEIPLSSVQIGAA
ncbi:MAG: histidine kinase [Micavibrio aeruginosavorus]|uniref:histidine kinase n=1 Tax=Micavibrio aeruginosavorus TaxID=349221 RepID=A0A2W5BYG3_9BACT|nr:MAG: histidine kinase [Micavibrio aeruginosavorus]